MRTETSADLQDLAKEQRLTLAIMLNGVWALVIRLSSGQEDVIIGYLTWGRSSDLEGSEYADDTRQ